MFIVKYRKIWYVLSGLFVATSLFAIFAFGLKPGIDFTGGSLLEVEYTEGSRPNVSDVEAGLKELNIGQPLIRLSGDNGFIIRAKDLNESEYLSVMSNLSSFGESKEIRFDSIGPVIGKELREKSWIAILLVILMIVFYIAFTFRKVSVGAGKDGNVSSFKYGLVAIIALAHDVVIPAGVFAALGKYLGVEIDILFITALLTVLGFSVNDTIVTFDRIRENLNVEKGKSFEEIVGLSIKQTLTRSINTSFTIVIVLLAIYFFAGESTKYFAMALLVGIVAGTYSSIFLASPLLVTVKRTFMKARLS